MSVRQDTAPARGTTAEARPGEAGKGSRRLIQCSHQDRQASWGVHIRGLGRALPEKILTNADLERTLDTSDEWIASRTGIRQRRVAGPDEATSDLAVTAAREALAQAGWTAEDVDLIVVATATPDTLFPSTACVVQRELGASRAGACDVSAACSGFVYALSSAAAQLNMGVARRALVVGAETLSKIVNWQDRATAVLLGDGAGAVALEADTPDEATGRRLSSGHAEIPDDEASLNAEARARLEALDGEADPDADPSAPPDFVPHTGLLSIYLGADGRGGDLLRLPAGGSRLPASRETVEQGLHFIQMNGREVFKFAVQIMGDAAEEALRRAGLTFDDVDLYVPHQANHRIIEASARRFGLPMDQVWMNIDRYGNTSSASIPIALYEAHAAGRLHAGDVVLLVAFGGGLTWGAAVIRWG